jgi:hypothetical protein
MSHYLPPETKKATKTIASFAEAVCLHGFIINIYFLFTFCLPPAFRQALLRPLIDLCGMNCQDER